jgi:hypothetical protein
MKYRITVVLENTVKCRGLVQNSLPFLARKVKMKDITDFVGLGSIYSGVKLRFSPKGKTACEYLKPNGWTPYLGSR